MLKYSKLLTIITLMLLISGISTVKADDAVNMNQLIESSTDEIDPAVEPVLNVKPQTPEGSIQELETEAEEISEEQEEIINADSGNGNCQVIITNTDKRPDDIWRLSVDGKQVDMMEKGEERFWGLNLTPGKHAVTVTGAFETDNTGNYSIEFLKCKVIEGPPTDGFNGNENSVYTWFVEVE